MTQHSMQSALSIAALLLGGLAAVSDVRTRRIPNLLTGPAMLLGLILHFAAGGWPELASSFGALLLCGFVFLLIYLAGGMGAGDVKLIAAEGCLLGLSSATSLLAFTGICGGVLALIVVIRHGRLRQTAANVAALLSHHARHGLTHHPELNVLNANTLRLPYGLAIVGGCVLTVGLRYAQVSR